MFVAITLLPALHSTSLELLDPDRNLSTKIAFEGMALHRWATTPPFSQPGRGTLHSAICFQRLSLLIQNLLGVFLHVGSVCFELCLQLIYRSLVWLPCVRQSRFTRNSCARRPRASRCTLLGPFRPTIFTGLAAKRLESGRSNCFCFAATCRASGLP